MFRIGFGFAAAAAAVARFARQEALRSWSPYPNQYIMRFTACILFSCYHISCRHYTNLRHRFLRLKSAHQRTIVVEGVPKEMRSDSKLFTYFNTLYPDEVCGACRHEGVADFNVT